MEAVFVDWRLY